MVHHSGYRDFLLIRLKVVFLKLLYSIELPQKAFLAGIPIVAAVGPPSSLALELAEKFNMTLLGFVSKSRFNIYHGGWRIQ